MRVEQRRLAVCEWTRWGGGQLKYRNRAAERRQMHGVTSLQPRRDAAPERYVGRKVRTR